MGVVREWLPNGAATEPGTVSGFDGTVALQRVAVALALAEDDMPTARAWLDAHPIAGWPGRARCGDGVRDTRCGRDTIARRATSPWRAGTLSARPGARQRAPPAARPPRRPPLARRVGHRRGPPRRGGAALAAALALAEACAAPYERALTLLALAELHLATGDRPRATTALAEARAILVPLGARPALARAAALAGRLEATP